MGRHRVHRTGPRDVETDASDLLAGRSPPTARQLMEAIHAVNPTGLDLSPAESSRRYILKGRLQSLLIEGHGADLEVQAVPVDPTVVGLRHRFLGLDGCHAPLAALTDAARSWVQFQLDTETSAGDGGGTVAPRTRSVDPGPPRRSTTSHPLALGRDAMALYEYDSARAYFLTALAQPIDEVAAACALLELLVDHLAADDEALALEARLSSAVAAAPGVRGLLAVAAARSADTARARRLLVGLEDPRAVDALVLLARKSLAGPDTEASQRLVAEVRRRAATHPSLPDLDRLLASREAAARQPAEDAAVASLAQGDLEGAETQARAVLARWGDSAGARGVLREVRARRQMAESLEVRACATSALAAGTLDVAETAVRRLVELGADADDLAGQLAIARREAREATLESAVDRVVRVLATDLPGGLRAWLACHPEARARVITRVNTQDTARDGSAPLQCLAAAVAHGAPPGESLVAAVLSLRPAEALLASGDPDGALATLQSHGDLLAGVATAREITLAAQRTLTARRLAAWTAAVTDSETAMARGDTSGAGATLAAVQGEPPGELRARVDGLRLGIARADDIAVRTARIDRLEADGQWLEARNALDEACAAHPDMDLGPWHVRRVTLDAALRRAWRAQSWEYPAGGCASPGEEAILAGGFAAQGDAAWRVLDDGTLGVAGGGGRWLLVWVLDPDTLRVLRRITVQTPEPVRPVMWKVEDGVAWFIGRRGRVVAFDFLTLDIVAWRTLGDLIELPHGLPTVFLVGGRFVWVHRAAAGLPTVTVVDLTASRAARRPVVTGWMSVVRGLDHAAVVAPESSARGAVLRYFSARGEPLDAAPLHSDTAPALAEAHPDGRSVVVFDGVSSDALDQDTSLRAYVTAPGHSPGARHALLRDWDRERVIVAGARSAGLVFVIARDRARQRWLMALGFDHHDLVVRWRSPVAEVFSILQDKHGRTVTGLCPTADGLRRTVLGEVPPSQADVTAGFVRKLPNLGPALFCHAADCTRAALGEIRTAARGRTRPQVAQWVIRTVATRPADEAAELTLAAARLGLGAAVEPTLQSNVDRFPDHPAVVLLQASLAALQGRWTDVTAAVDTRVPEGLRPSHTAHWLHLRGLAQLRLGNPDEALRAWTAGAALDAGACSLAAAVDLVAPLVHPLAHPAGVPGEGAPSLLTRVRAAVATADACLDRGDADGALRAMALPAVAASYDLQSLARWAAACVGSPPATVGAWFSAIEVVASLAAARTPGEDPGLLADLPLPGATWDAARLDDFAAQCQSWLEATEPPVEVAD